MLQNARKLIRELKISLLRHFTPFKRLHLAPPACAKKKNRPFFAASLLRLQTLPSLLPSPRLLLAVVQHHLLETLSRGRQLHLPYCHAFPFDFTTVG